MKSMFQIITTTDGDVLVLTDETKSFLDTVLGTAEEKYHEIAKSCEEGAKTNLGLSSLKNQFEQQARNCRELINKLRE